MSVDSPLLQMEHISKAFPGVKALDDVSLTLYPGEVLALVGENGAGKSTLMKILSGAYHQDAGEIVLEGRRVAFATPSDAMQMGIRIMYQELNYLPEMSIAENVFLGAWPRKGVLKRIDYQEMRRQSKVYLEQVSLDVDPFTRVGSLSVAEKQLVEIAKALSGNFKVLVMDEPTSSLNETETQALFGIIRKLVSAGKSVIYISHRLEEIFEIANRVQIMRDGRVVGVHDIRETSRTQIVHQMVGREIQDMYPKIATEKGDVAMEVRDLTNDVFKGISFHVCKGEILGLFGLMGAGRTNIVEAIYGARNIASGEIWIEGKHVQPRTPAEAMRHGIGYLPSERKLDGLLLDHTIAENVTLASINKKLGTFHLDLKRERQITQKWIESLNIKTPGATAMAGQLSGGNQQKVVLAKALETDPRILFLNEPTRGIDVGAKVEIYRLIEQLCARGIAVVMISSEIPEILGIADRIVVVCEGRVTGELERSDFSSDRLMELAIGGT